MLSTAYRLLTDLGGPVIQIYLRRRMAQGREDSARFSERLGIPSQSRPRGRLVWCHAASVGEAASLLALIERLRALHPETSILITTGTVTSARMLEGRMPAGVLHQYMPVDRSAYVARFLDYWRPDFAIWIESELWPNMLAGIKNRLIPAVLLNGSMSDKSFRNWYKVKSWSRRIFETFSLCLTQTEDDRSRFVALGARPVRCVGNLKYAGNPLPFSEEALAELKVGLGDRPCWLMASTHRGEEEMALETHRKLRAQWPQLLTILVPRHAVRGEELAAKLGEKNFAFARRSKHDAIKPETEIYLADTMGELGLFYRLSPIMFMGGTLVPVGGHNLIEPAQLGCAILFGPHMHDFSEMKREFLAKHAAIQVQNANELPFNIDRLLAEPETRERYANAARQLAAEKRHVLDKVLEALKPWLEQGSEVRERAPGNSRVMA